MKRLDCSVVVKSRSQKRFKIPVYVHLDDISSSAEPVVTKLGMVMHHHGLEMSCGKIGLLSSRYLTKEKKDFGLDMTDA